MPPVITIAPATMEPMPRDTNLKESALLGLPGFSVDEGPGVLLSVGLLSVCE